MAGTSWSRRPSATHFADSHRARQAIKSICLLGKAVASIFLLRDEPMKRTKWLAGYAFTFVAPVGQS